MTNLRDGYFARSPYIPQWLERAVSLAAAEDRGVVRPEPEQVLVSVVALHEDAPHLPLAFHERPLIRAIHLRVRVRPQQRWHTMYRYSSLGPRAVILANHDRLVGLTLTLSGR